MHFPSVQCVSLLCFTNSLALDVIPLINFGNSKVSFRSKVNDYLNCLLHHMFCRQPNVSGGYMSAHPFGQEVPYPGNQFHTQNVVRPAGGNPFG